MYDSLLCLKFLRACCAGKQIFPVGKRRFSGGIRWLFCVGRIFYGEIRYKYGSLGYRIQSRSSDCFYGCANFLTSFDIESVEH